MSRPNTPVVLASHVSKPSFADVQAEKDAKKKKRDIAMQKKRDREKSVRVCGCVYRCVLSQLRVTMWVCAKNVYACALSEHDCDDVCDRNCLYWEGKHYTYTCACVQVKIERRGDERRKCACEKSFMRLWTCV